MNLYVFHLHFIHYNTENKQTNKKPLYSSPKIMASAYPVFKFSRFRLGVRVPSFHNFGNLGGQLESRYDDARSEK